MNQCDVMNPAERGHLRRGRSPHSVLAFEFRSGHATAKALKGSDRIDGGPRAAFHGQG